MLHPDAPGLLLGAVALGAVHGVEPGHGWPVAASYALDRSNKWAHGFAASLLIGVGHLVSSLAMVGAFFYAKSAFDLARVNEPITLFGGVQIGGPVSVVAGLVLVALGVREYLHGFGHDHEHDESVDHENHDEHGHAEDGVHEGDERRDHGGLFARLRSAVPFVGSHDHPNRDDAADRGLAGIAWFAFVLGFAHEEEIEIIALCAGSNHCLALMSAYALTVVAGIVGLTLLLIAGYEHFEETVEAFTPYLPVVSAVVLVGMGIGFVTGIL